MDLMLTMLFGKKDKVKRMTNSVFKLINRFLFVFLNFVWLSYLPTFTLQIMKITMLELKSSQYVLMLSILYHPTLSNCGAIRELHG